MTEPLVIELTVACSVDHAFRTWTEQISHWWPRDHSVSGDPALEVLIEPGVGGRIIERLPDGTEYNWGQIRVWDPPHRIEYLWHIAGDRADATDVTVTFSPAGPATTVRIEHRGWERFGTAAEERRARNRQGWQAMLTHYETTCAA